MKRLTKDERTGATAIALVALLVCGAGILFKHTGSRPHASPEMVKSIILASDSIGGKETATVSEGRKRKSRKKERRDSVGAKGGGAKKKSKKAAEKSPKKTAPSRDYLSEPL